MDLIKSEAIIFNEIELSSGQSSKFYYDIKKLVFSEAIILIGDLMFDKILKTFPSVRSVGGLETGAVSVTTAIVFTSNQLREGNKVTGFFVRKERKQHGLQKVIEGIPETPLVVVDDVVTTGKSVMQAIETLNEENITPIGVVSVIDREDPGNQLARGKGNIKFDSLFKHSEFKEYIDSQLK